MRAAYQGQRNEQAAIVISFNENEAVKAEKVASKMMEYGYCFADCQPNESWMLVAESNSKIISQMKEDYKFAKKEALN